VELGALLNFYIHLIAVKSQEDMKGTMKDLTRRRTVVGYSFSFEARRIARERLLSFLWL
jgi:hypothetical protein